MSSNGFSDLAWLAQGDQDQARIASRAGAVNDNGAESSSGARRTPASARIIYTSEDSIFKHLSARLRRQLPFTQIGDKTLIAFNAHRVLSHYGDGTRDEYALETSASERETKKEPHIYGLAAKVYRTLQGTSEAQGVIFHGHSGSGKSYLSKLFADQILTMSTNAGGRIKLAEKLRAVDTILQSFGNAKTAQHSNASRLGRFTEYHFDTSGRLTQAKVVAFLMDKRRVVKVPRGQRTFHVFYQLLAGASQHDKEALKLKDLEHYRLLEHSGCVHLSASNLGSEAHLADDAASFSDLLNALKTLNLKAKHLGPIYGLLVTILELANITFSDKGDESALIDNGASQTSLDHAAELLGLEAEDLQGSLTNKTRYIQKELCTILLDAKGAARQRDSLVAGLYSILLQFLIELLNSRLCLPPPTFSKYQDQSRLIATLDLPGHQNRYTNSAATYESPFLNQMGNVLGQNSIDEFAINFAAEATWQWTAKRYFDLQLGYLHLMQSDDLEVQQIAVRDNASCLELLRGNALIAQPNKAEEENVTVRNASSIFNKRDKKPGGILGCIEQQFQRTIAGEIQYAAADTASSDLYSSLMSSFGTHSSFSHPAGSNHEGTTLLGSLDKRMTFTISHFGGRSMYDATDFLDDGIEMIDPDFITLLQASQEPLMEKLFRESSIAAKSHPLEKDVSVCAQVSNVPIRGPTPVDLPVLARGILNATKMHSRTTAINAILAEIFGLNLSRTGPGHSGSVWNVICLQPNELSMETNTHSQMPIIDQKHLRAQLGAFLLPDLITRIGYGRCGGNFCIDYLYDDFIERYRHLEQSKLLEQGQSSSEVLCHEIVCRLHFSKGQDYEAGKNRIWLTYDSWMRLEDSRPDQHAAKLLQSPLLDDADQEIDEFEKDDSASLANLGQSKSAPGALDDFTLRKSDSRQDLLLRRSDSANPGSILLDPNTPATNTLSAYTQEDYFEDNVDVWDSISQVNARTESKSILPDDQVWNSVQDSERISSPYDAVLAQTKEKASLGARVHLDNSQIEPMSTSRRWWIIFVWGCTWWIPTFLIRFIGRKRRADIIMAWREKVALCMIITFICGVILFYIIAFGRILCPNFDKAWNTDQLATHQGTDDFYVAVRGNVYDLTKFYRVQHSDVPGVTVTTASMLSYAGMDLTEAFPIPLTQACPGLIDTDALTLVAVNSTISDPTVFHYSGNNPKLPASYKSSALAAENWYFDIFLPRMQTMQKGVYVFAEDTIASNADSDSTFQVIIRDRVYDFSDYVYAQTYYAPTDSRYAFLDSSLYDLIKENNGQDITSYWNDMDYANKTADLNCINNLFFIGTTDFRLTARCQVQNYILLAFSIILVSVILVKFVSALQLTPKRNPEPQSKFVICQVPCYTEDHDTLKKCIDSLATLEYDDKAKLLMFICDGMIVGSGNDKPTPRIVLDILGVDPSLDPEPLMMRSVGEGSRQLNFGKIYSGLYEVDGHVVPYMVIVKVGKPSERNKPGNRGKRDSQVLLLRFLNKVHFDGMLSPLELEMYDQIKNVIGIDPAFYEYVLMVDADTTVHVEALNRLVARTTEDSKIVGICGETSLANEDITWWTMIQVYEYYISHHLAKAFESLFGSVTCLPGCFCMYRIRSVEEDGSRPLIISEKILNEYAECNVDTLHKKNLLALGEDRYLTTLVMKHLYRFKNTFASDAKATTAAPDKWSILLSQRRRWINSTVHNLWELVALPEHCGFLCFSMRFVVLIDMIGTIILPATVVYLIYLIVVAATGASAFPLISIIMIGAVYGLQMIILLLKRQWQHIGWLLVYLLAYPIYGFVLPIYSFWHFDDFSWGSTRVVVGEKGAKKIVYAAEDMPFNESTIPLKKWSDHERDIINRNDALGDRELREVRGDTYSALTRANSQTTFANSASLYAAEAGKATSHAVNDPALTPPRLGRMSSGNLLPPNPYMDPMSMSRSAINPSRMSGGFNTGQSFAMGHQHYTSLDGTSGMYPWMTNSYSPTYSAVNPYASASAHDSPSPYGHIHRHGMVSPPVARASPHRQQFLSSSRPDSGSQWTS